MGGFRGTGMRTFGMSVIGGSRMSGGASSLNCSQMMNGFGGDETEFKTQVNLFIAKKLRIQERVFQTQLRNVKTIATQEAI